MSIEAAREHLKQWGVQDRILEFPVSSATVELAAQALGCQPERIAKTLAFQAPPELEATAMVIVVAGDAKVDNKKFKAVFRTKPKMLKGEQVTELIGHAIGGVCPFGVKPGVRIYLDNSLKRFSTVFPAAGSSNSAIELSMEELMEYAQSRDWVDVVAIP